MCLRLDGSNLVLLEKIGEMNKGVRVMRMTLSKGSIRICSNYKSLSNNLFKPLTNCQWCYLISLLKPCKNSPTRFSNWLSSLAFGRKKLIYPMHSMQVDLLKESFICINHVLVINSNTPYTIYLVVSNENLLSSYRLYSKIIYYPYYPYCPY